MEFTEFIFGESQLKNPLKVKRSKNFYNEKWLYFIAGVHGNEIEGIYLLNEIVTWLSGLTDATFPCIEIPVLDVDGYLYQDQAFSKKSNLNNLFPVASFRSTQLKIPFTSFNNLRPEISSIIKLFRECPPKMVINFRTAQNTPKIISVGEESHGLASFLSKATNYPLIADDQIVPGTLESFIFDFFLCPIVTIRLPRFSDKKTVKDIAKENIKGFQQLLSGQIY